MSVDCTRTMISGCTQLEPQGLGTEAHPIVLYKR